MRADYDLLRVTGEFWRCPHSGLVLTAAKDGGADDKVLCGCGKTVSSPDTDRGMPFVDAPGTHFKRFLPTSTVDAYIRQEEARDSQG